MTQGYDLLARGSMLSTLTAPLLVTPPGSGATITLFDSTNNADAGGMHGLGIKRIYINIYSSAASATTGLTVDESTDGGVTWRNVTGWTISATTYSKKDAQVAATDVRVRYQNSANVLTVWEYSVLSDAYFNGALA